MFIFTFNRPLNNADYGMTLQSRICDYWHLDVNDYAQGQFTSNYNEDYEDELSDNLIKSIFDKINARPIKLLTFTKDLLDSKQTTCPHNFLLDNGKTLSIKTAKSKDKVAPRTVGQAGFNVLNDFFSDIYGKKIENQNDIKYLVINHIHEILPIFIDHLFKSDYTVIIERKKLPNFAVFDASKASDYSFSSGEFSFTKGFDTWSESTTLKFHNKSIAEIQIHKNRTFKFRFCISAIPEWIKKIEENNETLGISTEYAICEKFGLDPPDNFNTRSSKELVRKLEKTIDEAFKIIPNAIRHTGSESGSRGEQSKCSYDFVLEGNKTLSVKSNKGKMVCPPEVGQPSSKTCLLYFKQFFPKGLEVVSGDDFKKMVFDHIEEILPIYVDHLFDSDWLLWIFKVRNDFEYKAIAKDSISNIQWNRDGISFTKPTVEEWNESNTIKYQGVTIGEFQVHSHRGSFKFRFNLANLLTLILI